jgi:hypothetical protein
MKEVKNRKEYPTKEEVKAATQVQAPEDGRVPAVSTFKQLAKFAQSAKLVFGNAQQFVKPEELFNDSYRDGLESPPFFITNAFRFQSKNNFGERFGFEIVLSNGRMYLVALPFNEGDLKRTKLLEHFQVQGAQPIGAFCLTKLDLGRGNPYYDIVPYDSNTVQQAHAHIEIPFVEIQQDNEIPF